MIHNGCMEGVDAVFGCFIDKAPGSFYHIGAGCSLTLHNPGFLPEENVVTELALMHAGMVMEYLFREQALEMERKISGSFLTSPVVI